tara:strand:+ start:465 stop:923 length:459 start_codon:yes stop_codon:yes gene_type:complete
MIAVIKTGGKQYSVKEGQILKVEKLEGKKGDIISINNVLMISDKSNNSLGNPLLKDVSVDATIVDQIRDKKIIVFKKRKRQNYRLTQGHRQYLTVLKINTINQGVKKPIAKKIEKNDIKEKKEIKTKAKAKNLVKKKVAKKTTTKKTTKEKK